MKTHKKIFIGGLGALTPVIMNLLVIDLEVLLVKLTLFAVLGYLIRVITLFYLGGLVAFLHKDEKSPVKIFELGIVAPALITALLNAGQVEVPEIGLQVNSNSTTSFSIVSSAYAQAPQPQDTLKIEVKTFSIPAETKMQQFWRGLFGLRSRKVWYVIVGSHQKLKDAKQQVKQIKAKTNNFTPAIYAPYKNNNKYTVVIGANLTRVEAQLLQRKALAEKIAQDVYLWTFPDK